MTAAASAFHVFEYNAWVYRRIWRGTLFLTFLAPILFLGSMGFGLGSFVDASGATQTMGGLPYAVFLAPGLLAAQGMNTAGFESTYPIMGSIKWDRTYHGMLATPIGVRAIVIGQLGWIAARLALVSGVFFLVMVAFGLVLSPTGIVAWPAAILTGLAFAAPIMAFAATQQNDNGFNFIFRFLLTPLFLFSGTFFPIDQLPEAIRWIAYLTPTYHGVALARAATTGTLDPTMAVVNVAYLSLFVVAGTIAALVTFRRALVE
jgi:lipooligosaccharide transport system permease protein